jgi:hypothetical protein
MQAGLTLVVLNFMLHEHRYNHPWASRLELKLSMMDLCETSIETWGQNKIFHVKTQTAIIFIDRSMDLSSNIYLIIDLSIDRLIHLLTY